MASTNSAQLTQDWTLSVSSNRNKDIFGSMLNISWVKTDVFVYNFVVVAVVPNNNECWIIPTAAALLSLSLSKMESSSFSSSLVSNNNTADFQYQLLFLWRFG